MPAAASASRRRRDPSLLSSRRWRGLGCGPQLKVVLESDAAVQRARCHEFLRRSGVLVSAKQDLCRKLSSPFALSTCRRGKQLGSESDAAPPAADSVAQPTAHRERRSRWLHARTILEAKPCTHGAHDQHQCAAQPAPGWCSPLAPHASFLRGNLLMGVLVLCALLRFQIIRKLETMHY